MRGRPLASAPNPNQTTQQRAHYTTQRDLTASALHVDTKLPLYISEEWGLGFKHFDRYKEQISGEVELSPGPSNTDASREKLSSNRPLVGLHVRRGDSNDGQLFSLPSENYYLEGIAKVKRSIPNPRILLFTDDPAWVSRNLPDRPPGGAFLQTGSKPLEDFALMPLCEGHVTSNSGFSLMAAWVSGAPPERIAVPRRCFNNSIINYNRLSQLPDAWLFDRE